MNAALKKRLLIGAGVLAALTVLGGAALIVAVGAVDADKLRPAVEAKLAEAIGRDVAFSRLEVRALPVPALLVSDLRIAAPQASSDPWVEVRRLRARVALMPLLSGRIEVMSVALEQPTVRVLRAPDGRVNLATLLDRKGGGAPSRVSIGALEISGGRILVADAFVHPGRVESLELSELNVEIQDLSARPLRAVASGRVDPARGSFRVDGRVGPGNDMAGALRLDGLALAALSPWLEGLTGMADIAGALSCDIDLSRGIAGSAAKGSLQVKGLALPVALARARALDAGVELDVVMNPAGDVDVRRFDVETGATRLAMAGQVASRDGAQEIDISLRRAKLRIADVAAAAAALGVGMPEGLAPHDSKSGAMEIEGRARVVRSGDPLIIRSVAVDGLDIAGARLTLRRDEAGRWQLPGMGDAGRTSGSGDAGPTFRARNVKIRDAAVFLDDRQPGGLGRLEITGVNVSLSSHASGQSGSFDLKARAAGGSLRLTGELSPATGRTAAKVNLDIGVEAMNLAELRGALGSAADALPRDGTITWHSSIDGEIGRSLTLVGQATIRGARMELPGGREVVLDLPIEHDLRLGEGGSMLAKRLVLGLPGGPLALSLQVDADRFMVATDGETSLSPESLRWLLALAGEKVPFGLETEEPVRLDARIARIDGRLQAAGHLGLARARVTHALLPAPLDVAKASVALEGDRIEIEDAAVRLGGSTLAGSASIRNLDAPSVEFDLVASEADLDELFAMAGSLSDRPAAAADAEGSLASAMRGNGRLRVEHATLGGIELRDFDTAVTLGGGVLAFDPATLSLYDGTARASGRFDLREPRVRFDVNLALDRVDLGALMAAGLDYRDLVGHGDASVHLVGSTGTLEATLGSLRGSGEMSLRDGVFRGLNALAPLKKAGVFGEQSLASLADRLSREGTPFSRLDGRFGFEAGLMKIEAFDLASPDADVAGRGHVSLLTQQLDLGLLVLFAKPLSEEMRAEGSRAAQFFWDSAKGRVSMPAKLTGPLTAPSADIDYSAAAKQAAKDQLGGLLGGLLGQGPGRGSSPGDGGGVEETSEATVPSATPAAGEEAGAAPLPADGLGARIDSLRAGGSALAPDIRLTATLSGRNLSHGAVTVTDSKGVVLARIQDAFRAQVTAHRATVPADEPTSVSVSLSIDGKKLLGAKKVVVRVRAVDASGAESAEVSATTERGGLF